MKDVDIIISGGAVLTLDSGNGLIEKGFVAVKGDTIVGVGSGNGQDCCRAARLIDASRSIVMPGLINGHTHAAMTCFRGMADDLKLEDWLNNYIFPAEAKNVNPELVYWGSLLACAEMIRSGTTTFCDMYIFEEETARAARKAGMRCLIGEVLFDFPSPSCPTPEEGLSYTRRLLEQYDDDPLISVIVEPHALYTCSTELLKQARALADEFTAPLGIHLLETAWERKSLEEKLGIGAVGYLDNLGFLNERFIAFHCVALSDADIRLFAERGCSVIHNPESNMKLASGVAPVQEMIDQGVVVGLGTDGCASNNNLDMLQEMDIAAKLQKVHRLDPAVMKAERVVSMATSVGSRALGLNGFVGSLKEGMKADIIIIDCNQPHLTPLYNPHSHLVYAAKGADVKTVIINGRIVMDNRLILSFDEQEAMDRVRRIALGVQKSLERRAP
ncbi:MAG: amidohydrolase [Deltaproteobacteria bacterium]|nr:amidohydrolase [Deltaproteobacteria bacterium]